MNIIFLRHGEATDNVKELFSDKEIYWSTLTENGINTAKESITTLPKTIDKIYVSPLPRTIETAHYVYELYPNTEVVIDNRIREINHGIYTHQKNNEDLDNTRIKQINGDYFIRLGIKGENNFDIESRLCSFLKDLYESNLKDNTIMVVSHGSITSYMKRILKIKTPHIQTGKTEIFNDVDFNPLFEHIKKLETIKEEKINSRLSKIEHIESKKLKSSLESLIKNEFNNVDITEDMFNDYIEGLNSNDLVQVTDTKFDNGIILVCFYDNFEEFASRWIEHYLSIGIKNFVLVSNDSNDNSTNILKSYTDKVNISFWKLNKKYNNLCGLKQRIFEHYKENTYLTVEQYELFICKEHKNINDLTNTLSLTLDVYSNEEKEYVDKSTYRISSTSFGQMYYGGPLYRLTNKKVYLQKIPLIKYTGNEIYISSNFYYPFDINKTKNSSYLLSYKRIENLYDKDISISLDEFLKM